jgi:hypothetical protein
MVDHESPPGRRVGQNRRCFIVAKAEVYCDNSLEAYLNQAVLLSIHEGRIDIGRQTNYHQAPRYAKDRKLQP